MQMKMTMPNKTPTHTQCAAVSLSTSTSFNGATFSLCQLLSLSLAEKREAQPLGEIVDDLDAYARSIGLGLRCNMQY
jgi:hypothetical protein